MLVASDLHFGKRTPSYDPEEFIRRLGHLETKLGRIRELLSSYDFDELVVTILGDANDGSDIYPTQVHHQAISNVEEQAALLADLLARLGRQLATRWGRVRFECVPGNHGRGGRFAHEAASWDIVAYRYLALLTRNDDNIQVIFENPDRDPFLRVMNVYGHGYLLHHGDTIRSWGGIPWYGMVLRLMRWSTASSLPPWSIGLMGHFHTFGEWSFNRLTVKATGTMVTDDEWSLRTFGWESAPRWHLFGVSQKYAETWSYGLELR